ncbi:hypothetical protein QTN25_000611 [Entamoeba marina]
MNSFPSIHLPLKIPQLQDLKTSFSLTITHHFILSQSLSDDVNTLQSLRNKLCLNYQRPTLDITKITVDYLSGLSKLYSIIDIPFNFLWDEINCNWEIEQYNILFNLIVIHTNFAFTAVTNNSFDTAFFHLQTAMGISDTTIQLFNDSSISLNDIQMLSNINYLSYLYINYLLCDDEDDDNDNRNMFLYSLQQLLQSTEKLSIESKNKDLDSLFLQFSIVIPKDEPINKTRMVHIQPLPFTITKNTTMFKELTNQSNEKDIEDLNDHMKNIKKLISTFELINNVVEEMQTKETNKLNIPGLYEALISPINISSNIQEWANEVERIEDIYNHITNDTKKQIELNIQTCQIMLKDIISNKQSIILCLNDSNFIQFKKLLEIKSYQFDSIQSTFASYELHRLNYLKKNSEIASGYPILTLEKENDISFEQLESLNQVINNLKQLKLKRNDAVNKVIAIQQVLDETHHTNLLFEMENTLKTLINDHLNDQTQLNDLLKELIKRIEVFPTSILPKQRHKDIQQLYQYYNFCLKFENFINSMSEKNSILLNETNQLVNDITTYVKTLL